ncbi:MAG: hypothetical protein ABI972_20415 [Acidobacteriota bacterium]
MWRVASVPQRRNLLHGQHPLTRLAFRQRAKGDGAVQFAVLPCEIDRCLDGPHRALDRAIGIFHAPQLADNLHLPLKRELANRCARRQRLKDDGEIAALDIGGAHMLPLLVVIAGAYGRQND